MKANEQVAAQQKILETIAKTAHTQKSYAIFDLDGTLVDSMRYWYALGPDYLAQHGHQMDIKVKETLQYLSLEQVSELFVKHYGLSDKTSALEVMASMMEQMNFYYLKEVKMKPHMRAYLEILKAQGIHLCVASMSPARLIESCLQTQGIAQLFDFTLSCEQFNTNKSEPRIYREACTRWGISPEQAVVYEDSPTAAKTAKEAGFSVMGMLDLYEGEALRRLHEQADWMFEVPDL